MVNSDRELTIREARDDEEFGAWLSELIREDAEDSAAGLEERHLVLTDEIGDWIGGLRYTLRGGVASIVEIGVTRAERGRGHALRLLEAFERAAAENGAHVLEFWTDSLAIEPLLAAFGWRRITSRPDYITRQEWHLLEKRLAPGA